MRIVDTADTFDGGNLAVLFDLGDLSHAGADDFAIEDDRAGSADAIAAADLRACQAETAQYVGKGILLRIADEHTVSTVDVQSHFFQIHNCLRLILTYLTYEYN